MLFCRFGIITAINWNMMNTTFSDTVEFELSDSMVEELINLAITMALENVESPRLSTKLNTRGLEA